MKQVFKNILFVLFHGQLLFHKTSQLGDHQESEITLCRSHPEISPFHKKITFSHCCWSFVWLFSWSLSCLLWTEWVMCCLLILFLNFNSCPQAILLMYLICILLCALLKYASFDKLLSWIYLNGLILSLTQGFSASALHPFQCQYLLNALTVCFMLPQGFLEARVYHQPYTPNPVACPSI